MNESTLSRRTNSAALALLEAASAKPRVGFLNRTAARDERFADRALTLALRGAKEDLRAQLQASLRSWTEDPETNCFPHSEAEAEAATEWICQLIEWIIAH